MTTEIAAAAHPAAEHVLTSGQYITHHLGHLRSAPQPGIVDFSVINYDTIFWSIAMAVVASLLLIIAARRATAGVPGRFQAAVEFIVELVDDQAKAIVHGDRSFIAPLALTVFVWVALMNSMDFLPVDLFASLFSVLGIEHVFPHHRVVPTADLNGTMGIALGVLVLMLY